jgi:hypothetical protein
MQEDEPMMRHLSVSFILISLVWAGAVCAQTVPLSHPIDWQQIMQDADDVDETNFLLEPGDTDFLGPDVADLNNNGIMDVHEFELLEALADPGSAHHIQAVQDALDANVAQAKADFGGLITEVDKSFAMIGGALATLGAPGDFEALVAVAAFAGEYVANIPDLADYTLMDISGACGDPDGDGVPSINEFNAGQPDCSDCVSRALDPGVSDDGGDPYEVCTGGYGFFREGFVYDTASGRVYLYVEEPALNWTDAQAAAQALTIADEAVPANLATIDSAAIKDLFASKSWSGWTGGTDQDAEGVWKWIATGEQFWQGAADGSVVGGAYENWNDGEPNNAGGNEHFMEINSSGGWNDNGDNKTNPYIMELDGVYPDNNSNGIPDAFEDANDDGVPDGIGVPSISVEIDVISGIVEDMIPGVTAATLEADITGAVSVTSVTWEIDDTGVATLASGNGETNTLSAVAPGTATISVDVVGMVETDTGTEESSGSATLNISVKKPSWEDLCSLDDTFVQQGTQMGIAGGDVLGVPEDFTQWDIEGGTGDLVPDAWQLQLLAYVLCGEGVGAFKIDGGALTAQQYQDNLDKMNAFIADVSAMAGWMQDKVAANQTDLLTLAQLVAMEGGGACNSDVGGLTASDFIGALATGGTGNPEDLAVIIEDLATISLFGSFAEVMTGLLGLSTEMQMTILSAIPQDDLEDLLLLTGNIQAVLQGLAADCPIPDVATLADSLSTALGTPPDIDFSNLDLEIYMLASAKLPGEDFAGAGDLDGDGLTNAEVALAVIEAGGDVDDFIAGATGDFGWMWTGNPNLPVAAGTGLAMLVCALGGVAAIRIRKRR